MQVLLLVWHEDFVKPVSVDVGSGLPSQHLCTCFQYEAKLRCDDTSMCAIGSSPVMGLSA